MTGADDRRFDTDLPALLSGRVLVGDGAMGRPLEAGAWPQRNTFGDNRVVHDYYDIAGRNRRAVAGDELGVRTSIR